MLGLKIELSLFAGLARVQTFCFLTETIVDIKELHFDSTEIFKKFSAQTIQKTLVTKVCCS
jgi:hypothetical protein